MFFRRTHMTRWSTVQWISKHNGHSTCFQPELKTKEISFSKGSFRLGTRENRCSNHQSIRLKSSKTHRTKEKRKVPQRIIAKDQNRSDRIQFRTKCVWMWGESEMCEKTCVWEGARGSKSRSISWDPPLFISSPKNRCAKERERKSIDKADND